MFVGHIALGLAAKRITPRVSLAVLIAAAQTADMLWPVFVAMGLEQVRIDPGNTAFTPLDFVSYPYSHSLVTLILWGLVFAAGYRAVARQNGRTFVVLSALVVSHWVLDWITHGPDMALAPGNPTKLGLGLWNSIAGTLIVELALYGAGVWLYLRATRPIDRAGRRGTMALVAFLLIAYFAAAFGPLPPTIVAVAIGMLILTVILVAWAQWVERHRAMSR